MTKINYLFSYGSLQQDKIQMELFGRVMHGKSDSIIAYEKRTLGQYPIACFTANPNDCISGVVYQLSNEELVKADDYEGEEYQRVIVKLTSGDYAWLYCQNRLSINGDYLKYDKIRLELFDERHIPALCAKAQDPRIWQHHHADYHLPEIFRKQVIEKAKKAIAKNKRYMFVIYYGDELVGSTSYYDVNLNHLTLQIGYTWLHPDYWGKEINPIVKKLMLAYAFDELKFKRVSFCIDSKNTRSRAAIEKLGITFEGILENHQIRADLSSRDSAIYALTIESYKRMEHVFRISTLAK